MLCDAFCSHTALPRVKGAHQPRASAVFLFENTIRGRGKEQSSHRNIPDMKRAKGHTLPLPAPTIAAQYSNNRGEGKKQSFASPYVSTISTIFDLWN